MAEDRGDVRPLGPGKVHEPLVELVQPALGLDDQRPDAGLAEGSGQPRPGTAHIPHGIDRDPEDIVLAAGPVIRLRVEQAARGQLDARELAAILGRKLPGPLRDVDRRRSWGGLVPSPAARRGQDAFGHRQRVRPRLRLIPLAFLLGDQVVERRFGGLAIDVLYLVRPGPRRPDSPEVEGDGPIVAIGRGQHDGIELRR